MAKRRAPRAWHLFRGPILSSSPEPALGKIQCFLRKEKETQAETQGGEAASSETPLRKLCPKHGKEEKRPSPAYLQRYDSKEPKAGVLHEVPAQHQDAAGWKGEGPGSGGRGRVPGEGRRHGTWRPHLSPARLVAQPRAPRKEQLLGEFIVDADHTRVNGTLLIEDTVLENGSLAPGNGPFSGAGGAVETAVGATGRTEKCRPLSGPKMYREGGCRQQTAAGEQKICGPRESGLRFILSDTLRFPCSGSPPAHPGHPVSPASRSRRLERGPCHRSSVSTVPTRRPTEPTPRPGPPAREGERAGNAGPGAPRVTCRPRPQGKPARIRATHSAVPAG